MEDAKRGSQRIAMVERGFEQARLEGEWMAAAYERVLPVTRAVPARAHAKAIQRVCGEAIETTGSSQRYATGA